MFAELHEVVRTSALDRRIGDERREAYAFYDKLTPPRVMTSEGEIADGQRIRVDGTDGYVELLPPSARE